MERINLTKYGFERTPEDDFSDDGNRFTCYRLGNIRVSKLVADGQVYISGRMNADTLTYDEYLELPHYRGLDALNCVSKASVSEESLIDFYNCCIAYQKEYEEAAAKSVFPTFEELKNYFEEVKAIRMKELAEVKSLITPDKLHTMFRKSKYNLEGFFNNYDGLVKAIGINTSDKANQVLGSGYSKTIIKRKYDYEPSYNYKTCIERLKEVEA